MSRLLHRSSRRHTWIGPLLALLLIPAILAGFPLIHMHLDKAGLYDVSCSLLLHAAPVSNLPLPSRVLPSVHLPRLSVDLEPPQPVPQTIFVLSSSPRAPPLP